jgi:hypothetical protein
MLNELRQLHSEILSCLDQLEALTAEATPPMERLPAVRYSLTRASRSRTMLLERLYGQLLDRADPGQRAAIERLKAEGKNNLVRSAEHIGSWTLRAVTKSWPEYCAASKSLRAHMRQRIALEQRVLYPLFAM